MDLVRKKLGERTIIKIKKWQTDLKSAKLYRP